MWVIVWIVATIMWAWFAYSVGHWRGAAAAHRYHVDRMLERADELDGS